MFGLNDDLLEVQKTARSMAYGDLRDLATEWDRKGQYDRPRAVEIMGSAGFIGMTIPEKYGGSGASLLDFVVVLEEIAATNYSAAFILLSTCSGPVTHIEMLGNDQQRQQYLPAIASGEHIAAMAITEADAGSDVGAMQTRVRTGPNGMCLNGRKIFVGGAGDAEALVVYARLNDDPGSRGVGCLLLPANLPGISFGEQFEFMGTKAVPRRELLFDDCAIPNDAVLLAPGNFRDLIGIFNGERIHNAALGLGMAQGAFDHVLAHVRERQTFGRRIIDNQGVQWRLAEMKMRLEAARLMMYRAADAFDRGADASGELASQAKLLCATTANLVVNEALQFEGGSGYTVGGLVERAFRDSRMVSIAAGSNEMMLNRLGSLLAKR